MPGGGKMPMKMKSGGKMKKYMGGGKSPMKMPGGGKLAKQAAIAMAMKKAGKKPKSMKKGGKFPDLNKDGKITMADILMGRGVKAKKGMKGMKYENGGKLSKSKRPKKMEKISGAKERGQVGNPMSNKFRKEIDRISEGSRGDLKMRVYAGKTAKQYNRAIQRSQEVPNPGLGKKTEDFGTSFGKVTGRQGNPGGLKGKTKGKGGNVGAGVKVKKKRRLRR